VPVTVTISTDAFPQPHQGDPITLSNTKLTIAIDASLLQQGVDLGLITDGMQIPSTVTLVLTGTNTTEGTHTYVVQTTNTVHVVGGKAQPLTGTVTLPNTTWHPKNDTDAVFFNEKSVKVVSHIDIIGGVTSTIACTPHGTATVVALAAQGNAVPTTLPSTTGTEGGGTTGGTTTGTGTTGGTSTGSGSLPFTGASSVVLIVLAGLLIEMGVALMAFSRRKLARARHHR